MITYVLPCAGKGSRLGLPYPKELHRIQPDMSLIDFSLNHIKKNLNLIESIVTVISPGKEEVHHYTKSQFEANTKIEQVYFNNEYSEWPGSIRSGEKHFSKYNVALLPDSIITMKSNTSLGHHFMNEFQRGADLVFAYINENDAQRLSCLGALSVDRDKVNSFCDKPDLVNAHRYNAFWVAFGFKRKVGSKVLDFMMDSVARKQVDLQGLGLNVKAFSVNSYFDLGTWSSIASYLNSNTLME